MDVTNVFLQGNLTEEIYMTIPPRFEKHQRNNAYKLLKFLYGLKQASGQWSSKFCCVILEHGFVQSSHDHSLFVKRHTSHITILLVYVDDIVITGNDASSVDD